MKKTKLFELVTGTEMKPWLSQNMLPNINTCENGWSNFSANLRIVSLKLLELTQFTWPNLSINFHFLWAVPRDDVIESTRFLMRAPVNHSTMIVTNSKLFIMWMHENHRYNYMDKYWTNCEMCFIFWIYIYSRFRRRADLPGEGGGRLVALLSLIFEVTVLGTSRWHMFS